ncbi:hypothetical protein [Piscinibacter sakaiensis]|uniref:hypothetical protein n=1 Tax=Piscinibacter sakaiensis TaxID=1547922 RepID=UPI003AAD031A
MSRIPALLALLLLAATSAHAGRPLNTDDAGVLDRGACELEGAAERQRAGSDRSTTQTLQLGCGVGRHTQLALATGRAKDAGTRADLLGLSGKTALAGDEGRPMTTLGYGIDGSRSPGGNWRHAASALTLIHSRPLGHIGTLHLKLGHSRDEVAKRRSTPWGIGFEHAALGSLTPVAELHGDDREAPRWNVGLRWTVAAERVWLDASYGRQIAPGRPQLLSVGFKLGF